MDNEHRLNMARQRALAEALRNMDNAPPGYLELDAEERGLAPIQFLKNSKIVKTPKVLENQNNRISIITKGWAIPATFTAFKPANDMAQIIQWPPDG